MSDLSRFPEDTQALGFARGDTVIIRGKNENFTAVVLGSLMNEQLLTRNENGIQKNTSIDKIAEHIIGNVAMAGVAAHRNDANLFADSASRYAAFRRFHGLPAVGICT